MATRTETAVAVTRMEEAETEGGRPMDTALLYGVSEAAQLLGIGRSNAYNLMTEGKIRYVKIGSRRLIPRIALEQFVAELIETSWSSDG